MARETALSDASWVGSCLLLWCGALLCPAASLGCSHPRHCLYKSRIGGMWKADPVMCGDDLEMFRKLSLVLALIFLCPR